MAFGRSSAAHLVSIVDIALAAGDLFAAARTVETFPASPERVQAAAAVAEQATRAGDRVLTARMVDLVAKPSAQATVWLVVAGAATGDLRRQSLAQAVRLDRWHAVVEAVVEEEPSAFEAIYREFEAVQD